MPTVCEVWYPAPAFLGSYASTPMGCRGQDRAQRDRGAVGAEYPLGGVVARLGQGSAAPVVPVSSPSLFGPARPPPSPGAGAGQGRSPLRPKPRAPSRV